MHHPSFRTTAVFRSLGLMALASIRMTTPAMAQDLDRAVPGAISGMRAYLRSALGTLHSGDVAALRALPDSGLTWVLSGTERPLAVVFHQAVTEPIVLVRQGLGLTLLPVPEVPAPRREALAAVIDSTYAILLNVLDGLSDDALYSQMFRITRPEVEPYHFYAQPVPGWQVFVRAIGWGLESRGMFRGDVSQRGFTLPRWHLP